MGKILAALTKARGLLHLVAIVASAGASALAAVTVGGDPVLGAAVGGVANTLVAAVTA